MQLSSAKRTFFLKQGSASVHCEEVGITVVVPTRNSEDTIEACLESILAQSLEGPLEVVVVDNGSEDDTLEIVSRFPVTLQEISRCFVSRSRNIGAMIGNFPILAFVDSDCVVLPGWAEGLRVALCDGSVAAVGAKYLLRDDPTWVELAWNQAVSQPTSVSDWQVAYLPGGNMAVRRSCFRSVGGFDESLETGEDHDLCIRLDRAGLRVYEDTRMRCVHLGEPRTLGHVFRKEKWHGRGLRLRYSDGRLAPIALSTLGFLFALVAAFVAIAASLLWQQNSLWLVWLAPVIIVGVYAVKYAQPSKPAHLVRLIPIYFAYFLGRSMALPVVAYRMIERRIHGVES